MIKSNDYPNIVNRVKKLEPIINQYDIENIAMASFCISVCVSNRSVLESTLALNWAIANHNSQGDKRIETYDDFTFFFKEIEDIMQPDIYSDFIEEDFGEVSIDFFGKKYSVIIGTGHNMVFACLQFLPYLAQEVDKREELINVLNYYSSVIDYLKEENKSDGNNEVRFVIPSRKLFERVKLLFLEKDIMQSLKSIAKIIDSEIIEKKHFIVKGDKLLPLANTSLLLDLYDSWYRTLDEEQLVRFINRSLVGITMSLSKFERERNITFLCPVARTNSTDVTIQLEKFPFVVQSFRFCLIFRREAV